MYYDLSEFDFEIISKGISILWVVPDLKIIKFNSKYGENVCHASKWILFFNTLDFGRLYIWSGESDLVEMVHLERVQKYIPEDSHFDEYGEEIFHGGYNKYLKNYRLMQKSPYGLLHIASDFIHQSRSEFYIRGWDISIPACLLWTAKAKSWWKR